VTTTGGCPPATTTGTITVTPLNTIAAGTSQTVCINSAITNITLATTGATGATFAGLPAGVTGSWAGNVATISGTPTASGTFNYTVTTTGGCPPATTTGTITVTPLNTIAAGTSQTVCVNSAITTITLATTGATGATFAGLPAGVTGSWSGNVVTISGTPTVSGPFNYTVTTTGGCPPATTTGTITVTPLNTIAAGTSQTVCVNSAITTITLATTGATGATFAGLPAGVTGSWSGNVVTISGTPTVSGPFNYTVTTTGGCPPATTTGTITVTPLNTIAAGTSQTVCVNSAITTITLATTGATGATFAGLPAGVTGSWSGNVVTISGTPTVSGPFNYTVTTTGGCPPATTTGTITVNPTAVPVTGFSYSTPVCINGTNPIPTTVLGFTTGGIYSSSPGLSINGATGEINLGLSTAGTYTVTYLYGATTCGAAGSSTFDITITSLSLISLTSVATTTNQTLCINTPVTNITYSVTNATGATVSGLPAGVTESFAAGVFTISGTPTASGPFNYTITTTGSCSPAATTTGTITVTPLNTIAAGTSQTVCVNSAITTITLATTGATGATFAGLPAGVTGSWSGNVVTISGTPTVSGPFNYTVTTTGGCPPATTTGTITVTPLNTIAAGTSQTVCVNSAITTITLATTGATGATFAGLPAGVTGSWSGNVVTISGTPTVSGPFNYTVTTTGGCPPATTTGTITVTPLNTIAAGTSQTVCINSAITNITLATTGATGATFAGLPAGVTGSWAGNVATISGTPTASGIFNYTVTTTGGCLPAATTGTITVTSLNTIAAGTSQTVCVNSPITNITLATTGATGATFAGLPAGVTGSWAG
ncbi:beta strand repeat-containing protein, partial [Flavobacterium helocola]